MIWSLIVIGYAVYNTFEDGFYFELERLLSVITILFLLYLSITTIEVSYIFLIIWSLIVIGYTVYRSFDKDGFYFELERFLSIITILILLYLQIR
jgi:hypothetical protein